MHDSDGVFSDDVPVGGGRLQRHLAFALQRETVPLDPELDEPEP